MKKWLVLLFFLALNMLFGQLETSNWYFGDHAGIHFNLDTGEVTTLNNGALVTPEGCTTISDKNGVLLFYTDGTTVYNANHTVMQNGLGLLGDESSTQSAIVVPKPNDPDIYYLFTVGSSQNTTGINYSEVNMTLDGGLGGITTVKNRPLLVTAAEKISAVLKDFESGAIWIITLSDAAGNGSGIINSFHAFEVNANGVNQTAVVSTFDMNILDTKGSLKFSPNGDKLASANSRSGLFIADFDTQTGRASNKIQLRQPSNGDLESTYGVEFSSNGELLYATITNIIAVNDGTLVVTTSLVQYNLKASDIPSSEIVLDDRVLFRGGLQLGPNGKIYRALSTNNFDGDSFLGVINNPNIVGAGCDYQHNAINLGNGLSRQGLPPFIQSFFVEKQRDTVYYCLNKFPDLITLENGFDLNPNNDYNYLWSTGETTPTIQVNEIGSYTVDVTNTNNRSICKIIVVAPSNIATIDTITITNETSENTISVFVSGKSTYAYALLNEAGQVVRPYQESNVFNSVSPGIYTVSVKDIENDCGSIEEIISVIGFPKFFTPNGDGYNDHWQVYGVSDQFQSNMIVYIFDRFGKLIKQISPLEKGWDGTFNGKPLPSSDYWFYVAMQNGRVLKDHFSLKR